MDNRILLIRLDRDDLLNCRSPRYFGYYNDMFDGLCEDLRVRYTASMDVEKIIEDIERLERLMTVPDSRPLNASDISAANRRHDESLARSPWFKLWRDYGLCCRSETPILQLPQD